MRSRTTRTFLRSHSHASYPPAYRTVAAVGIVLFFLTSCRPANSILLTADEEFALANAHMKSKHWDQARERFQRILDRHPRSSLQARATLGKAESYFLAKDCLASQTEYQLFLELYPTHESAPLALYRIGLCQFKDVRRIDRDQQPTIEAATTFRKLVANYASSQYAEEAKTMLRECQARLAAHDDYVARFYIRRKAHLSAALRYGKMLDEYELSDEEKKRLETASKEQWAQWIKQKIKTIELTHKYQIWFTLAELVTALQHYRPEQALDEKTQYYYAEALYQLERFGDARREFEAFQKNHPDSTFTTDVVNRLKELAADSDPTIVKKIVGP